MTDAWRSSRLTDEHDLTQFDCGVASLNNWLTAQALRAQRAGVARTYVWTPPNSKAVVAYYTITPTQVMRSELSNSDTGGYSVVPAYLLARLALDQTLHGQRYGTDLLLDAVEVIVRAAGHGGGRLIVVDALDAKAARFYRHHDFHPVKNDPLRLVMKVASAVAALRTAMIAVSADEGLRLASVDVYRPDGTTSAMIVTAPELRALADRIAELPAGQDVDIRAVFLDVLGRDILAD